MRTFFIFLLAAIFRDAASGQPAIPAPLPPHPWFAAVASGDGTNYGVMSPECVVTGSLPLTAQWTPVATNCPQYGVGLFCGRRSGHYLFTNFFSCQVTNTIWSPPPPPPPIVTVAVDGLPVFQQTNPPGAMCWRIAPPANLGELPELDTSADCLAWQFDQVIFTGGKIITITQQ